MVQGAGIGVRAVYSGRDGGAVRPGPSPRAGRPRRSALPRDKGGRGGGRGGAGCGMAVLGALVKKLWSVRRFLVLLGAPLVLVPVLLSLPPKVPAPGGGTLVEGTERRCERSPEAVECGQVQQLGLLPRAADWGHLCGGTEQGHA